MKKLQELIDRVISRVNINLREFNFDTEHYVYNATDLKKLIKFYASYGITSKLPLYVKFSNSNIAGSYFLGKCCVSRSVVYKSDVRGDELKQKGDNIGCLKDIPLVEDEYISIKDSLLFKTLVHSNSHNFETPEEFFIRNTVSAHYSNIHGSTLEGCFLAPFATVDIMSMHSCLVGEFSYVQTEELFHTEIKPGTVWIEYPEFSFKYTHDADVLEKYISVDACHQPSGILNDFMENLEDDFAKLFERVDADPYKTPSSSTANRFAVIKGDTSIGNNVLIAQRAYLNNAVLGDGSNAQENSFIIDSVLTKDDITAHGAKIIHSNLGEKVFVAFNCFLNGKEKAKLTIGNNCIVIPHTIIDSDEAISIPDDTIVWGCITKQSDLKTNSLSIDKLSKEKNEVTIGQMTFKGDGSALVNALLNRIDHILELNGAFYNKGTNKGHAQGDRDISFNVIQPYSTGTLAGLYPEITIRP